jgi:hypothetical protein
LLAPNARAAQIRGTQRFRELDLEIVLGMVFTVGALAGVSVMLGVVRLWRRRERMQGRRNPLTRDLLRSPGQSLRNEIDDLRWEVAMYMSFGMLPIPLGFGLFLASWAAKGRPPGALPVAMLIVAGLGALGWLAWKLWTVLQKLRQLRLGYDAELAVGQELNELLRHGHRVFHDFPVAERDFNIDHVVAGPAGVFAIETKGRSKPKSVAEGNTTWEVNYDGTTLQFPGWRERGPIRQAEAVGDWLQAWLSSAVGERVKVQPVVILPGWYVKRTGPGGVVVLASGQIASYFASSRPTLDAKLIQQIAHQLEQRCRDVTPAAYRVEPEQ